MDLKTLKTFHALVSHGSFIRTAEHMNYAQSTVTMQIQKLESDLGVQLLEHGRKFRLTEAGRLLYEQSSQIILNLEQVKASLADLQAGEAGSIRLGVTEPTASYRLPAVLSKFMELYPKIRISVDVANTPMLSDRVLEGGLDLALCSSPDLGSELYFEKLFDESFVALLPDHHPLACQEAIELNDLRGHRLLITYASCPYRRKLEFMLQQSEATLQDTMEVGSMTALKYYVASGLGIALVPRIVLQPAPSGTVARPISGAPIHMTFGILYKMPDFPLKRAAIQLSAFLQEQFAADRLNEESDHL